METAKPIRPVNGIKLTPGAAKKVSEFMKAHGKTGCGLRIGVAKGGCAGYSYTMDFDKKAGKNDKIIEDRGIKLFIDTESMELLKGTTIDYVESLQASGFRISNPNARASCGCGKSCAF